MDKNKATLTEIAILVASVIAFLVSIYVQIVYATEDIRWIVIVSQIDVLASIFLVTSNGKRGVVIACILNIIAGGSALAEMLIIHNDLAMTGILTAWITIVVSAIVYFDEKHLAKANEKLNRSFEELIEKNHQIQSAEAQLRKLAYTDALTGMNNRAWLVETLEEKIRADEPFVLIVMDMDNFKQVNDNFGHPLGDTLIQTYATRFQKYCGTKYSHAKIGGDEFAMIVEGSVTQAHILNMVEQMRNLFGESVNTSGRKFHITMSYGIAGCPNDGMTPKAIIHAADTALYNAKMQGKDRPIVYSPQSLS